MRIDFFAPRLDVGELMDHYVNGVANSELIANSDYEVVVFFNANAIKVVRKRHAANFHWFIASDDLFQKTHCVVEECIRHYPYLADRLQHPIQDEVDLRVILPELLEQLGELVVVILAILPQRKFFRTKD